MSADGRVFEDDRVNTAHESGAGSQGSTTRPGLVGHERESMVSLPISYLFLFSHKLTNYYTPHCATASAAVAAEAQP